MACFFTSTWTSSPGRSVWMRRTTRPVGRSIHASRFRPWRTSTRCAVERGTPTTEARRAGPSLRRRRSPTIRFSTLRGVRCGHRCGRLDRSSRPASPSASQRRHHFDAVWRETFMASAAAEMVQPDAMRSQSQSGESSVRATGYLMDPRLPERLDDEAENPDPSSLGRGSRKDDSGGANENRTRDLLHAMQDSNGPGRPLKAAGCCLRTPWSTLETLVSKTSFVYSVRWQPPE